MNEQGMNGLSRARLSLPGDLQPCYWAEASLPQKTSLVVEWTGVLGKQPPDDWLPAGAGSRLHHSVGEQGGLGERHPAFWLKYTGHPPMALSLGPSVRLHLVKINTSRRPALTAPQADKTSEVTQAKLNSVFARVTSLLVSASGIMSET